MRFFFFFSGLCLVYRSLLCRAFFFLAFNDIVEPLSGEVLFA